MSSVTLCYISLCKLHSPSSLDLDINFIVPIFICWISRIFVLRHMFRLNIQSLAVSLRKNILWCLSLAVSKMKSNAVGVCRGKSMCCISLHSWVYVDAYISIHTCYIHKHLSSKESLCILSDLLLTQIQNAVGVSYTWMLRIQFSFRTSVTNLLAHLT